MEFIAMNPSSESTIPPAGMVLVHDGQWAVGGFRADQKFLNTLLQGFTEEQGQFTPVPGMMTVAQQVRHIARTVDWFREAVFGAGFDMDFEKWVAEDRLPCTLTEAREQLTLSFDALCAAVQPMTAVELCQSMGPTPLMPGASRLQILSAITDHTAHHRGSLAVYLRLLGQIPPMVYTD
jgi:uncharacterized damage-inducible protein DinB